MQAGRTGLFTENYGGLILTTGRRPEGLTISERNGSGAANFNVQETKRAPTTQYRPLAVWMHRLRGYEDPVRMMVREKSIDRD